MKNVLLLFLLLFTINTQKSGNSNLKDINTINQKMEKKEFLYLVGAKENECLPSVENTVNILKEKYGITVEKNKVNKNMRFIAGNCNPVILIPGLFSVRLRAQIDCKNLFEKEKDIYKKLKFFCLSDVCPNIKNIQDLEYFFSLSGAFGFGTGGGNKYNACFSYLMNVFNKEEDCASNTCTISDYINIMFDGGTEKTYKKSNCGTSSIDNIAYAKLLSKSTNVFGEILDLLEDIGYNYGFSMGGIPNDFRKFATNEFSKNAFRFLVESLYKNTGKKVIVVAHSYGNLVTLNNLVSNENQDLIPKIKKYVAIAPPFAGSSKLTNGYLHGLKYFNYIFDLIEYNSFGQSLAFKSSPTLTELRPSPIFYNINKSSKYKEFVNAINDRISLEECIREGNCAEDTIKKKSENFDNYFSSYLPSLNNNICQDNSYKNNYQRKCFLNLFNIFQCPMVVLLNDFSKKNSTDMVINKYCNLEEDNLYYAKEIDEEKKKSVDELLTKGKYTYGLKEMDYFFNKYKEKKKDYGLDEDIELSDFETEEEFRKQNLLQIEYQKQISLIKDLPIPPVDVDLVYTSAIETQTGEFLDKDNVINQGKNFYSGGDGTVSTWSSLLVGLKWIYDKKTNNLNQNIKLVEFCSKLQNDFPYNETNNFVGLGCSCLKNNNYKDIDECEHQSMLSDTNLLSYLKNVFSNDVNITQDRINAANQSLNEKNYEEICNVKLLNLVNPNNSTDLNLDDNDDDNGDPIKRFMSNSYLKTINLIFIFIQILIYFK